VSLAIRFLRSSVGEGKTGVVGVIAGDAVGVGVLGMGVSIPLDISAAGELGVCTLMGCGIALRRRTSGRGSSLDPRPFVVDLSFIDAFFTKVFMPVSAWSDSPSDTTELAPSGEVYIN
jgi:hypothetical protein